MCDICRLACCCLHLDADVGADLLVTENEINFLITLIQVDIDTDLYPSEISWELLHGNGDVVLRWARTRYGPTTDYSGLTAEGLVPHAICCTWCF